VTRDGATRGRHLATAAIHQAIENAGIEASDVDVLFVGNMTAGTLGRQQQLGGLIADYAGLSGIEAVHLEAACASGAAAARMAYATLAGGIHRIAVVCGVERMTHADRPTVTRALATATDWELEGQQGESFLSLNARLMQLYFDQNGVQPEDFAPFSLTAHANSMTNEHAVFRQRVDLACYRESRTVIDPLRLYDVSPTCNGAAAIVVAGGPAARDTGRPPVRIAASAAATAPVALARRTKLLQLDAVTAATRRAFEQADVRHDDIDLFELHDAYTIMTALSLESSGFAEPGTSTRAAANGDFALDGRLPISTMGGLKARGHPVGATGVYQIVESYLQLTSKAGPNQVKNARTALVQNIGGTGSTVINHILRRED
jgi:acetyl-CoA C-acetyltransferase